MGQLNHNDMILHATKLEPLSTGNSIYTLTDKKMWVFGSDVRAIIRLDKHQVQRALTRCKTALHDVCGIKRAARMHGQHLPRCSHFQLERQHRR